jgi:hypothetical protein
LPFLKFDIATVNHLEKQARDFERYGRIKLSRAKTAEVLRKIFVSKLLEAANEAGGHLGLTPRNGRGSLVEVINLLQPYLPAEFQTKLSIATLRRIIQSQRTPAASKASGTSRKVLNRKKPVAQKLRK